MNRYLLILSGLAIILISCTKEEWIENYESNLGLKKIATWKIQSPELVPHPRFSGVLHDGSLILVDLSLNTVNHFDRDGKFIKTFGREGRGPGEFSTISHAAIHPDGRVAVADNRNARFVIHDVFKETIVTEYFRPGWNPQLTWIKDGLVITNYPFEIMSKHPGDILMHFYNAETRLKEQFLHLELESDRPPDQISCTFCDFKFQDDLTFFTTPQDTSYRIFRKNPTTKTVKVFTRSGGAPVKHSDSEIKALKERAVRLVGNENYTPPTHKVRILDFFPDHEGRLWVLMNVYEGDTLYFDLFSPEAEYIGSIDMPDGAESIEFVSSDQVLFRYRSDDLDIWEAGLYMITEL